MRKYLDLIIKTFNKLTRNQKIAIGAGIGLLLMFLIIVVFSSGKATRVSLFPGQTLSYEEAASITSLLTEQGIIFQLDGTRIMIANNDRDRVMMTLAQAGALPGKSKGFNELFGDGAGLGETRLVQLIKKQEALQGALENAIRTLSSVSDVQVLLALPPESLFVEEQEEVTASVVLG
ncbi:MAG: hypothetical protein QGH40_10950, partial [bacterium]|nr:hypothetical protein [bacterium]